MVIHTEDLPAATRKKLGIEAKGRSSKPSRANTGHSVRCPGWCSCGERFSSYSRFEKHAKAEHATSGVRWSIELPS